MMVLKAKLVAVALAFSAALSRACLDGVGGCSAGEDTEGTGGLNISFLQREMHAGKPADGANKDDGIKPIAVTQARVHVHSQARSGEHRALPACAAGWGTFGKTPFTRSQIVPFHVNPKSFYDFRTATVHNIDLPFVSTEYNFGMCTITKVASTDWANIFSKIVENDPSATYSDRSDGHNNSEGIRHTQSDLRTVFEDPKSVTAVLLREPLSRFASVFLAKCSNKTLGTKCFPSTHGEHLERTTMKQAVEWVLEQAIDEGRSEPHWGLQSDYCELRKRVWEYDYVLRYSKNFLAADAACLMEIAGIDQFNSMGPEKHDRAYWQEASTTDEDENANLKLLFTPDAARQVIRKFKQDYDTFRFPEPAWVAEATGLLYEVPIGDYESWMVHGGARPASLPSP